MTAKLSFFGVITSVFERPSALRYLTLVISLTLIDEVKQINYEQGL